MSVSLQDFLSSLTPEAPIEIYTDGACSGNPGPGGWGAVLRQGSIEVEMSGGEDKTTNNRMEMMAAIESLTVLPANASVKIFTDSQYLKDGITLWMHNWKKNGWKTADKKPVKNKELWERLDELSQIHTIQWEWVRGHNGHVENERADTLARRAIIALRMAI